jgi:hypothetical protein
MLQNVKDIEGYSIGATDGDIGSVKDFYFDDGAWVVRYVVAETGSWLNSRKVLISPMSIGQPDWDQRVLPSRLKRQQVKDSPNIDTDKPVSRQHESDILRYYHHPYYWGGGGLWGDGLYPSQMISDYEVHPLHEKERAILDEAYNKIERARHAKDDPHLRSCNAVIGYNIEAHDGEVGHVHGMLVDDETWAIRYLVVNTSNWWVGQKVLIAPSWIEEVSWIGQMVVVNLTREAIKGAPLYDPTKLFERSHEDQIYGHHKRPGYWQSEALLREVKRHRADAARAGD